MITVGNISTFEEQQSTLDQRKVDLLTTITQMLTIIV